MNLLLLILRPITIRLYLLKGINRLVEKFRRLFYKTNIEILVNDYDGDLKFAEVRAVKYVAFGVENPARLSRKTACILPPRSTTVAVTL